LIMAKPMRKDRVLIHSAVLSTYVGDDGDSPGNPNSVDLKHIRIDEGRKYSNIDGRYEVIGNALMFVDAVNSVIDDGESTRSVTAADLITKSEIEFKGKTYSVQDYDTLYADSKQEEVHHWEVLLK